MGNVIQGINQDGSNSGTFMGNYHNIGSTTTNFTGTTVNFTGTNQRIVFGSTGSTGTITYWNAPSFMTGASFPDGTRVTFNNNSFLDSTGKINSSFIPATTSSSIVNTIQLNQSLSGTGSINLSSGSITGATGFFQTLNSNNTTGVLNLFPSHTGNIEIGNTNSSSYIYFKNNLYSGNSSKGINAGYYDGYSSNGNVSLGGSINQGNVNVGKDLTSGNVNVGNSAAAGTGTINLYQDVVAAKNLTLNSTNGIISAPTHTGSNYYLGTTMTGPGSINVAGNITTSGTISGASFTGSNYYLGTSMTGPGSINVTGNITTSGTITNNGGMTGSGAIYSRSSITSEGNVIGYALTTSTSKVNAGTSTSGGLKINGRNQWTIGENSSGDLCFYHNTTSLTTPLACITTAGNLVAGTG